MSLIGICFLWQIDYWLVVENQANKSDVIVVLGGSAGSRLRKGIRLYDQGLANQIILVDEKESSWTNITNNLCKDCVLEGKDVIVLTGSTSTFTDASLVKTYCSSHGIKTVLVVTDPYHTRRVWLTFAGEFRGSTIAFTVISSNDYNSLLSPGHGWWKDKRTAESIWLELMKCLYVICVNFIDFIKVGKLF